MTNPTPSSVTVVRFAALTQALVAFVLSAFVSIVTLATYVSDRADAAAGHPDEWAGLGEFVGVVVGGLLLAVALIVGLPTLLLQPHRPGPRIALVIGEVVTGGPLAFVEVSGVRHDAHQLWVALLAGYLALSVVTVWLLLEQPARQWSADRAAAALGGDRIPVAPR